MSERNGQIQRVLSTLASHGDLIAEGLVGTIHSGGGYRARDKAIEALVSIHALTPYEEGAYRLNPRLREFISDHLVSYNAFQTLTRLRDQIYQARTQWTNLRLMHSEGVVTDAEKLEWALDDTVTNISYEMDRNLTLLNSHISTEYGNVESLSAKIRQNVFYAKEVKSCLDEIRQLDSTVEMIDGEALSGGFQRVRALVNGRLRSRLHHWTTRLNDIQHEISKRLFKARKLEQKLRNLGKVALWLNQNQLTGGFDIDVDESLPVALITPTVVVNTWNVDVRDTDPIVYDGLVAAVARLPAPRMPPVEQAAPDAQQVMSVVQEIVVAEREPVDDLIEHLLDVMLGEPDRGMSLLEWKRTHGLADVGDEEWLLYASSQMATMGYKVDPQLMDRAEGIYNDLFDDIVVSIPT
ncbi:hypothetical protein [Polaromonas sp. LjRoot131]|uniref:hypothetical protein n=1 Tax=Polaromonas sp. LjRoot131 TaxID=3342262 RepID=UPI003ECCB671